MPTTKAPTTCLLNNCRKVGSNTCLGWAQLGSPPVKLLTSPPRKHTHPYHHGLIMHLGHGECSLTALYTWKQGRHLFYPWGTQHVTHNCQPVCSPTQLPTTHPPTHPPLHSCLGKAQYPLTWKTMFPPSSNNRHPQLPSPPACSSLQAWPTQHPPTNKQTPPLTKQQ